MDRIKAIENSAMTEIEALKILKKHYSEFDDSVKEALNVFTDIYGIVLHNAAMDLEDCKDCVNIVSGECRFCPRFDDDFPCHNYRKKEE